MIIPPPLIPPIMVPNTPITPIIPPIGPEFIPPLPIVTTPISVPNHVIEEKL